MSLSISNEEKMLAVQNEIEELYQLHDCWTDSIISYCVKYDLEEFEIVPFLSPFLINELRHEAVKNKTIRTELELPF